MSNKIKAKKKALAVAPKTQDVHRFGKNGKPSLHVLIPLSKSHAISQLCRERTVFQGGIRNELGDRYSTVADRPIPEARNTLAEKFMAEGADIALWIDDDCVWEPAHVHAIRNVMAELPEEVGMVSAIATDRKGNGMICAYNLNPKSKHYDRIRYGTFPEDKPFEVGGVGHHFCAVRRSVYQALPKIHEGWYWFFPNLSEDLHFCTRAREEAGAKIMVDPRLRVGHMGEIINTYDSEAQAAIKIAARQIIDKLKEQLGDAKADRDAVRLRVIEELQRGLEPMTAPAAVPAHLGAM